MNLFKDQEGLCGSPEPVYLFVDLGKDPEGNVYGWHTYDRLSDKATPIYPPALLGVLKGIKVQIRDFQGKENMKVDFRVQSGDRTWIIRSGVDTVFSRGVLLGLREVEDFTQPVKIYAQPGETSVLGNVYDAGNVRYAGTWDTETKLFPIIQDLQTALGGPKQTMEDIRSEYEASKNRGRS